MSGTQFHICDCGAGYPTPDALTSHLKEEQTSQSRLQAIQLNIITELTKCRLHRASPKCESEAEKRKRLLGCPWAGCEKSFDDKTRLKRHFYIHTPCAEVCVICLPPPPPFTIVSQCLRHIELHKGATGRKGNYLADTADDLRKISDALLDSLHSEPSGGSGNKRPRLAGHPVNSDNGALALPPSNVTPGAQTAIDGHDMSAPLRDFRGVQTTVNGNMSALSALPPPGDISGSDDMNKLPTLPSQSDINLDAQTVVDYDNTSALPAPPGDADLDAAADDSGVSALSALPTPEDINLDGFLMDAQVTYNQNFPEGWMYLGLEST